MDKDVLIEKYLTNNLSKTEKQLFDKLIVNDEDFRTEVELRSVLFADYKVEQKLKMRAWAKGLEEKKITPLATSPTTNSSFFSYFKRFAALVIVGITAYFLYTISLPSTNPSLLSPHLLHKHPSPTVVMGKAQDKQENWELAIAAYRNKRYDLTADELLKLPSLTEEQQFYLGLSYLYQEPSLAVNAADAFEPLYHKSGNFNEEALWFGALAYLEGKDEHNAKVLLKRIVDGETWKVKEARELLEGI